MNTLPAERDLPPAARDALRARLVETAGHPAQPRRWVPLAAAAGLAAVVAGTAVAVAVSRGGPPPVADPVVPVSSPASTPSASASGTATPTVRPPTTHPIPKRTGPATVPGMLADCTTYARNMASIYLEDSSPTRVKALFHDRYGYLIEIRTAKLDFTCDMSPTGAVLNGSGGSSDPGLGSELGYITRPGIAIEVTEYGSATPARQLGGVRVAGHVRRGVDRVMVTWPGQPPVRAALNGPFFIARVAVSGRFAQLRGVAVAYDAAGHKLGTSKVFG